MDWFVTKNAVYFVDVTQPQLALKFFDLATRRIRPLKPVAWLGGGPNLAVSPTRVYYCTPKWYPRKPTFCW